MGYRVFIDSFSDGWYAMKSVNNKQTVTFEDSDRFGPSLVNVRTGDVKPIPERHWFWNSYAVWRANGKPIDGRPVSTPWGPVHRCADPSAGGVSAAATSPAQHNGTNPPSVNSDNQAGVE
jgi:hypothetical protein